MLHLCLGRGQKLLGYAPGRRIFQTSKKVLAPSIFFSKKVSAPSFFFSEKVVAPSFNFSEKVLAPSKIKNKNVLTPHFSRTEKSLSPSLTLPKKVSAPQKQEWRAMLLIRSFKHDYIPATSNENPINVEVTSIYKLLSWKHWSLKRHLRKGLSCPRKGIFPQLGTGHLLCGHGAGLQLWGHGFFSRFWWGHQIIHWNLVGSWNWNNWVAFKRKYV